MKNSEQYFKTVRTFIAGVEEISTEYDATARRMEAFKGSEGYTREIQAAAQKRDSDIMALRASCTEQFRRTAAAMRDALKRRPLVPPTPEQAALLTVLQMRQSVSRDELDRAALQLEGCPAALAVLADLAEKHKVIGFRYKRELTLDDALSRVDTLERSALGLIQEGANAACRRVPDDVMACMNQYGRFNPVPREGADTSDGIRNTDLVADKASITAFCKAVDG